VRLIGLTGGIASGKSTVRRMLEVLGAQVLDADAIYHELIRPTGEAPSPLARRIAARFPGVLGPDGAIDRAALGAIVFDDPEARQALGEITHPAVAAEVQARTAELARRGVDPVIYDVPLLFERGLEAGMHGVIVVWVPRAAQVARLCARDGLSSDAAAARLAAQWPLDDKRARADWLIDNSGTLEATQAQVERAWAAIVAGEGPRR